jgi:hypothetical protein
LATDGDFAFSINLQFPEYLDRDQKSTRRYDTATGQAGTGTTGSDGDLDGCAESNGDNDIVC